MYIPGTWAPLSTDRGWGGQTRTAGADGHCPLTRPAQQGGKPGRPTSRASTGWVTSRPVLAGRSLCGHQACHVVPRGLVPCKSGPSLLSYRSAGLLYRGPGTASRARTPESGTRNPHCPPRGRPRPVAYRKRRPADAAREARIR